MIGPLRYALRCPLKATIKVTCRARTIELFVPCELPAGHLGRCEAPKLQAAAHKPAEGAGASA